MNKPESVEKAIGKFEKDYMSFWRELDEVSKLATRLFVPDSMRDVVFKAQETGHWWQISETAPGQAIASLCHESIAALVPSVIYNLIQSEGPVSETDIAKEILQQCPDVKDLHEAEERMVNVLERLEQNGLIEVDEDEDGVWNLI
jgi:flagellar motor switch protein FliG